MIVSMMPIRAAEKGCLEEVDLKTVARIHERNLKQSFLATLGEGFLIEMYRAIDVCPSSVLFVERDPAGLPIGFVSGAIGMGPIYRTMLRRLHVLPFVMVPSLRSPRHMRCTLEILYYSARAKAHTPAAAGRASGFAPPTAELLSIAVEPSARSSGAAARLYATLVTHFRAQGQSAFRIVVGEALEAAHRFYRKMGAEPIATTELHKGERSTIYVQSLGDWK